MLKVSEEKEKEKETSNLKQGIDIEIATKEIPAEQLKDQESSLMKFFEMVLDLFLKQMRIVGLTTMKSAKKGSKSLKLFYNRFLKKHVHRCDAILLRLVKSLQNVIRFMMYKVHLFFGFFVDAKNVLKKGYNCKKGKNIFARLCFATGAFFKGVYNNRHIFVTWFNYLVPVAAVIAFVYVAGYVTSLNFAVSVEYNGEHIGYIENEAVFEQAEAKLQERMTYMDGDEAVENLPKFSLAVVNNTKMKSDLELTDSIIRSSSEDIIKATGLTIDGIFYGAVKEADVVKSALTEKLNKYSVDEPEAEVKFTKAVSFEPGIFVAKNIKPVDDILKIINNVEQKDVFDQVVEGDTPIMIAARNDMSLDELTALNPDIIQSCVIGDQVMVNKSQAFLPVSVVKTETFKQTIPFEKNVTESTKYYQGYSNVTKEGSPGEKILTAKVHYVDNVEIEREVISTNISKNPVTEEVVKGVGVYKASTAVYKGGGKVSNSGFIWPVGGGYISSPYGSRGGAFHSGVDYAFNGGGYGKQVGAALAGKVVFAGWNSSYGNLVKIEHGGGLQTWYAHNSRLAVKAGQIVSQGQHISNIGSTGRSTGNHMHFEVRINGSTKNPLNYLP